jgi:tetrahydromethanopterin S-methyltransferase subunit G
MALSKDDLDQIRSVVADVVAPILEQLDDIRDVQDRHTTILDQHTSVLYQHTAKLIEHDGRFLSIDNRLSGLERRLDYIEGEVKALTDDIRELYGITSVKLDKNFAKLSSEDKVLALYRYVTLTAKALNIDLA